MPNLTKSNAKEHCRTCLIKINLEVKEIQADMTLTPTMPETKDICIDITKNKSLQSLISKYIGNNFEPTYLVDGYPQHICVGCFNKLQQTDKFVQQARTSAEKLEAIFNNELDKTEFICNEFNNSEPSRDIFKLLLKDTLMETEYVLLDNATSSSLVNTEVNNPDPFSNNKETSSKNDIQIQSNNESEVEYSDDEREWVQNSFSDNEEDSRYKKGSTRKLRKSEDILNSDVECNLKSSKRLFEAHSEKPATRLRAKLKNKLEELSTVPQKKKRRTKKEMEEFRQTDLKFERHESKNKRRQKGTKNNFKCTQCNHCFAHKITLDAHIRKVHEGSKRPFRCDRCDKSYTFIGGLYTHIKEIHEAEVRSYACDFPNCDRIYTSFIAMQKHKRLKHIDIGEQKKYVCEQCGATFNQIGNLKYHRRTKHPTEDEKAEKELEKERYECTICKKLFHSRYTLRYHTLQLHTNETKYECNVCGRKMAKKFMLVQHMLVHSTEKMPCEHCGKQFIRKFELEAHIRAVHMKLKPFECQYCSECFASRKTLRHHEYIHTGEKPYVCELCGQAYRQQTCLKNHRKSHEKIGTDALLTGNINRSLISSMLTDGNQQETAPTTLETTATSVL